MPLVVGGFHATRESLEPADPLLARLSGPTASDIDVFRQFKRIIEPESAAEAQARGRALGKAELTAMVKDILDNLVLFGSEEEAKRGAAGTKAPRLGFVFAPLTIHLPILRHTGRLLTPDKPEIVVKVDGVGLGSRAAAALAEALDFRIRDQNFLGGDVIVKPSVIPGSDAVGNVLVELAPLFQEPDLRKDNKLKRDLAVMWACTEAQLAQDPLDPRELQPCIGWIAKDCCIAGLR